MGSHTWEGSPLLATFAKRRRGPPELSWAKAEIPMARTQAASPSWGTVHSLILSRHFSHTHLQGGPGSASRGKAPDLGLVG